MYHASQESCYENGTIGLHSRIANLLKTKYRLLYLTLLVLALHTVRMREVHA